ncbi:MAG: DUF1330 domain-containing protein [Gammaproteobacteria bacterium]|nr:DUF1330 domain-containing protein [Gammaproteobacteria bacterium]
MPAYCIVRVDVSNPEQYAKYAELARPAVEAYGGEFLARGGQTIVKEGVARERNVIIRFESMAQANAFYESAEYQQALSFAEGASTREYIIVEGVN